MPVAPTTATRRGRGRADDIVIHRCVARSMELVKILVVIAWLGQVLKGNSVVENRMSIKASRHRKGFGSCLSVLAMRANP